MPLDYKWYVHDPRDDQDYEFDTIQEVGMFLYDNFDAGDAAIVTHDHEL